jgi:TetR/AcrR family transcriptional repressor of lmrAB and yxaGH operons
VVDPETVDKTRPTRERILRAGLHLFQAKGYHATGLTEILARAAAPKGSFYHHFPAGKEALAVACVHWLSAEVARYLDGLAAVGGDARTMSRGLARRMADGLRNPERMRGSLLAVLVQEAIPESTLIHEALSDYAEVIRRRLVSAAPVNCDARAFAQTALALLQGGAVLARLSGRPHDLEKLVEDWLSAWPDRA